MSAAQIYDWLIEEHGTLDFKDRALRLYINNLRDKYKIPKVPCVRQYEEVPEIKMGHQAQVDLGEIWLRKQGETKKKVYCFAMVLSHSRYKFLWWVDKPFTTISFIDAHNRAFEYFGGMPEEIVYDQDKILAVSENNGDIIYTEGFENYINTMKFNIWLCRSRDPESKGKIESVVKFAKYNFAKYNFAIHRTFIDIESFNDESLKWLKRTGNTKVHNTTKKVPAEVFALEKEHLKPIPQLFNNISNISLTYAVRKNNTILYKQNRYQLPKGTYAPGKEVKLMISKGNMDILDKDTDKLIVSHHICNEKGKLVRIDHPERNNSKNTDEMYEKAFKVLGANHNAKVMLDAIRKEKSRYCKDQFGVIISTAQNYDTAAIEDALKYCVQRELFSAGAFKDTLEYLNIQKKKDFAKKYSPADIFIHSKYHEIKPEVRSINEYIDALKEDRSTWKN